MKSLRSQTKRFQFYAKNGSTKTLKLSDVDSILPLQYGDDSNVTSKVRARLAAISACSRACSYEPRDVTQATLPYWSVLITQNHTQRYQIYISEVRNK